MSALAIVATNAPGGKTLGCFKQNRCKLSKVKQIGFGLEVAAGVVGISGPERGSALREAPVLLGVVGGIAVTVVGPLAFFDSGGITLLLELVFGIALGGPLAYLRLYDLRKTFLPILPSINKGHIAKQHKHGQL